MILSIRHVTHYRFDPPLRGLTQSLRLIPASFDGQKVESWDITCEGACLGTPFRDGAGDILRTLTRSGNVGEVEIVVTGTVVTSDTQGVLRGHREACPPLAYLRDTILTRRGGAVAEFTAAALEGAGEDALGRAHALSAAVAEEISYVPGVTEHGTKAQEVLSGRQGVCQDFAHVLIAAAREAGIPARYVSGYLHTENEEDFMGEASHAWAELHVPALAGSVSTRPTDAARTNAMFAWARGWTRSTRRPFAACLKESARKTSRFR